MEVYLYKQDSWHLATDVLAAVEKKQEAKQKNSIVFHCTLLDNRGLRLQFSRYCHAFQKDIPKHALYTLECLTG